MIIKEQMIMNIQVIPRPRLDVVVEADTSANTIPNGGRLVDNFSAYEPRNDAALNAQFQCFGFSFDIAPQNLFLFVREGMESSDSIRVPETFSMFILYPCGHAECQITQNDRSGKKQCETEIRLTLLPHIQQAKNSGGRIGGEEKEGRNYRYWKKIARRCFEPFKNMFRPVKHSKADNRLDMGRQLKQFGKGAL